MTCLLIHNGLGWQRLAPFAAAGAAHGATARVRGGGDGWVAGVVVAAGEMGRRWVVADSWEGCQQVVRDWERGLVLEMEIGSGEGGGRVFFTVFASVWFAMFSVDFFGGIRLQSTG